MNNKSWIEKVNRIRGTNISRLNALRLDKNERTTKFSSLIFEKILTNLRHEHLTAYPETEQLYDQLAKYLDVNREQIVVTAGSDAGIKYCFELLVERGSEIITLAPTFAMVDIYAQLYGVQQKKIGYNVDLSLQQECLLDSISSATALIVLANPNSPTGTLISEKDLRIIINKAQQIGSIVLVDEAYYGFCKYTALPLLKEYDNLVIARTFSKSFGLAGCRVGYLIAQPKMAQQLYRLKPMYEVNAFGVLVAMTMLENPEIVDAYIRETESGREYVKESMERLGINYIECNANFLHIDLRGNRNEIENILLRHNILAHGGPGVSGYETYLRLTLGPIESMVPFVEVIRDYSLNKTKI